MSWVQIPLFAFILNPLRH